MVVSAAEQRSDEPQHVGLLWRVLLPSVAPLTIFNWTVPLWADALFTLTFGTLMLALAVRLFAQTD